VFLDGKYLLLCDGTGQMSSETVSCKHCCEKHHKNGTVTYYHQLVGAVVAHPDLKPVIPLCPEPIRKEDGLLKNDCERNATERLLRKFRKEHPHLKAIVTEDALSANGPHIKLLKELDLSFIIAVKPDGNKALFDWVESFEWKDVAKMDPCQGQFSFTERNKIHKIRFVNQIPLNDAHQELKVNFIEYWELDLEGNILYHNSWITDIAIIQDNAYMIARGGRARWKVENETFNTLSSSPQLFS
jgi:hypothetical protein